MSEEWNLVDAVFREHKTNVLLAPLLATRTLVTDIVNATRSCTGTLDRVFTETNESMSNRQRRRLERLEASCDFAFIIFSFAAHVVLLSLQHNVADTSTFAEDELVKAVERSRMVVSTVSTFHSANVERAVKAAEGYTKGKVIRRIISTRVSES